jgi:hypothetical protein
MMGIGSHQTVAQQPQARPGARSDAIFDRMSEDFARRMACGKQE